MPDINPEGMGELRESEINMSDTNAWRDTMPWYPPFEAGSATNNADIRSQGIYCLFDHSLGSSLTITDVRFTLMSFDVSAISGVQSATLKVYGNTNSATGNPTSDSSNGIVLAKVLSTDADGGMAASDSVAVGDWDVCMGASTTAPELMATKLTSWTVGTSGTNDFVLNSAAIDYINDLNNFQVFICHQFVIDHFLDIIPFAHGNNSPNGDNDFTAVAGLYHGFGGSQAAYKPVLSYSTGVAAGKPPPKFFTKVSGGNVKVMGGNVKVGK